MFIDHKELNSLYIFFSSDFGNITIPNEETKKLTTDIIFQTKIREKMKQKV